MLEPYQKRHSRLQLLTSDANVKMYVSAPWALFSLLHLAWSLTHLLSLHSLPL